MKQIRKWIVVLAALCAVTFGLALAACGGNENGGGGDECLSTTVTVTYDVNAPEGASVTGTMETVTVDRGSAYTVLDCGYRLSGYRFFGWTTEKDGTLEFQTVTDEISSGYVGGSTFEANDDVTLYAQWGKAYYFNNGDVLYVCDAVLGYGAALLDYDLDLATQTSKQKLGFVGSDFLGRPEFTFYFPEEEGGDRVGLFYADGTASYRNDSAYGYYVLYNYVEDHQEPTILYLDGNGLGIAQTMVGDQLRTEHYGYYMESAEYGDYEFYEIDPATGNPIPDGYGWYEGFYFALVDAEVEGFVPSEEGTSPRGYYYVQGGESGSFLMYDNGDFGYYRLDLNGYGSAKLWYFDPYAEETTLEAEGIYRGTNDWTDYQGEWEFIPSTSGSYSFRFILNYVALGDGTYTPVYIEYNAYYAGTLTASDDTGATIELDGYGGLVYTVGGISYSGLANFGDTLITFYVYNDDGEYIDVMYFNVNWEERTFIASVEGFIIDDGVLIAYTGQSRNIVIPDEVVEIADGVFKDNALMSVTIPASVKKIGARAFQNDGTLERAIFLGTDPSAIEIDWSAANDPFRWPTERFVLVVPEESKEQFVAVWHAAWLEAGRSETLYRIKGSVEVTLTPEFEVNADGVLIAYNRPEGSEKTDIVITVGQIEVGGEGITITAIGPEAFAHLTWLTSIDLGENVVSIGASAFYDCVGLKHVTFASVQTIGADAFYGCILLGSEEGGVIELPAIVSIGSSAFMDCYALTRVKVGGSIESIEAQAFAEIATYAGEVFYLEITGGTVPPFISTADATTGEGSAFRGNVSYRIVVPNISYAIACYTADGWAYNITRLMLPAGDEAGTYYSGADTLVLDGRAVFLDGEAIWLYVIEGTEITFYQYDALAASGYTTIVGTIVDGTITLTYSFGEGNSVTYTFSRPSEYVTYTSEDGKYSFTAKHEHLQYAYWEGQYATDENGDIIYDEYDDGSMRPRPLPAAKWLADATFMAQGQEAQEVKLLVKGASGTYVLENAIGADGKHYNFTIHLSGDTFTYEAVELASVELPLMGITCEDGSTLNFVLHGSSIYVYGQLMIEIDGTVMSSFGDWSIIATFIEPNQFTFRRAWKNDNYQITVTVNAAENTFTYTYEKV